MISFCHIVASFDFLHDLMIKEKENIKHLSNKQKKKNNPDNAILPITFFFKADMQIRMKKALSL